MWRELGQRFHAWQVRRTQARLRRAFYKGAILSQFLAPDIRRDIEVLDDAELFEGFITARSRTWNVMYAIRANAQPPPFGRPHRRALTMLWAWTGEPWGGKVPDDADGHDD